VTLNVLGSPRYSHGPRRLQDGSLVVEDGLYGTADGAVVNYQHPIQQLPAEPEGLRTNLSTTTIFTIPID